MAAFVAFLNVNLLLPVLPVFAAKLGGGDFLAGLSTTVFMLATVLAQLRTPRLLARIGYGPALVAGLLLLGAPGVVYLWISSPSAALLVTLPRGVGFGIVTVAFAALVAEVVPAGRRGEGIGLYGLASTLPAVFGLPLGVWTAENVSFGAVFLVGALAAPVGAGCVLAARVRTARPPGDAAGFLAGLARGELLRPFLAFLSTTLATGVLVTFLPLVAPGSGVGSAAAALLAWGVTQSVARLWAGRFSDRFGAQRLLVPSLALNGVGMVFIGFSGNATLLLLGATINGFGFGVFQNAVMSVLVGRVEREEYGMVSTLWNVGFDAGAGLGPLLLGALVSGAGFAPTAAASAVLIFASVGLIIPSGKHKPGRPPRG
ncbi:MFS transporter [Rubrobacter tropicus]|uniref:MFS transporter n=1 Tax=Rubrobacter tropicus TaxID=2653851 RepID=UPI001D183795|nr:MFS transporter [Rubrobacter tropicus]